MDLAEDGEWLAAAVAEAGTVPRYKPRVKEPSFGRIAVAIVVIIMVAVVGGFIFLQMTERRRPMSPSLQSPPQDSSYDHEVSHSSSSSDATQRQQAIPPQVIYVQPQPETYQQPNPWQAGRPVFDAYGRPLTPGVDAFGRPIGGLPGIPAPGLPQGRFPSSPYPGRSIGLPGTAPPYTQNPHQRRY